MPIFEPETILVLCKNAQPADKQKKFKSDWRKEVICPFWISVLLLTSLTINIQVENRWKSWKRHRDTQSQYTVQLEWAANVVEYVMFIYKQTKLHGNSTNPSAPCLRKDVPFLGPHFTPLTYLHIFKRAVKPIVPDIAYLKPITVCGTTEDVTWYGWSLTGHREVHGINREETAIGFQLRCKQCEVLYGANGTKKKKGVRTWEIPPEIPIFLKCCAVTRELFDLVVELRPSVTAAGLAENIKSRCLSLDNTFHSGGKATVVDQHKSHKKLLTGGILSIINEFNEIIAWCFCQSQSTSEIKEVLSGLKRRNALLDMLHLDMTVVDNCCHVRNAIQQEFPEISVVLDVWHFMMRYLICISGGTKNPKQAEVVRDIVDAILKTTADKYNLAVYWSQEEQETRLIGAYEKWVRIGGVWTATTEKQRNRHTLISWSMYEKDALREFARTSHQMEAILRGLTKAEMVCSVHSQVALSNEKFGLTISKSAASYHNLMEIKEEPLDDLLDLSSLDAETILWDTNIDPALLHHPLPVLVPQAHAQPSMHEINTSPRSSHLLLSSRLLLLVLPPHHTNLLTAFMQPFSGSNQASSGLSARFVVASTGKSSREPIDCDLEFSDGISDKTGRNKGNTFLLEGVQSTSARAHSSTTSESPTMEMFNVMQMVSITKHKVSSEVKEKLGKRARLSTVTETNMNASATVTNTHPITPSHAKKLRPLHNFFAMHNVSGLTRSQQLFSISTGIDVRATSIGSGDEYFLFMDLRLKNRWVSFLMTPRKWVTAADEFNMKLAKLDKSKGRSTTGKTPHALMDKLGKVEPQVLGHVQRPEDGEDQKRKTHTCTRCKMVMYPGPEHSAANHKKLYCADGVRQKPKVIERTLNGVVQKVIEELPEYPQPAGLFTHSTHFHPKIFLAYMVDLYTHLIAHSGPGSEKAMEDAAFAALLTKRLRVFPQECLALFELFPSMQLGPVSADLVVERGGMKYLHVDYLSNAQDRDGDVQDSDA
ncbi:hypothetical protein A0H81_09184 [Grifola frondosa]|uniref:Uncharacterized protein n=1 Tax=Grifola frondosa TaxID=5627 RepID=A0A1C7M163_GRIFR|nr:hypothetical protein A0H81_09184 [Grifola frondosa]